MKINSALIVKYQEQAYDEILENPTGEKKLCGEEYNKIQKRLESLHKRIKAELPIEIFIKLVDTHVELNSLISRKYHERGFVDALKVFGEVSDSADTLKNILEGIQVKSSICIEEIIGFKYNQLLDKMDNEPDNAMKKHEFIFADKRIELADLYEKSLPTEQEKKAFKRFINAYEYADDKYETNKNYYKSGFEDGLALAKSIYEQGRRD